MRSLVPPLATRYNSREIRTNNRYNTLRQFNVRPHTHIVTCDRVGDVVSEEDISGQYNRRGVESTGTVAK